MPLVNGLTDFFKKKNVMIFGPDKKASRLEGSKAFMKKICKEFKIPTAKYKEISHINETKNLFNEFYFFQSNKKLINKFKINVFNIKTKLNKKFKNKYYVNTYLDKDKLLHYY